jgi:hypothetical protein
MATNDTTRRRHVPLVDVTQAAGEVSRLVHGARDLKLPVEPGVRKGSRRPRPLGSPAWGGPAVAL